MLLEALAQISRNGKRGAHPAGQQGAGDRGQPEQPQLTFGLTTHPESYAGVAGGLTEVLVTGILIMWIRVRARPMARPAKPAEANFIVGGQLWRNRLFGLANASHHLAAVNWRV
jgi:hypothetical protein